MAKVIRPDGQEIRFEYDALGRRIQKIVGNKTTHWVWDGNNPLHEWVDYKPTATQIINAQNTRQQDANADKAAIASRNALSTVLDHQGPPSGKARFNEGTQAQPITWLFEPDSFTPMAKLVGDEHYSIITDHLGTPNTVFDKDGNQVWSADISVWGELRNLHGDKDFCPFRYPGQYEDSETGLYYNRFRYYDPEAGRYVSQDPISLVGGDRVYAYVHDCTTWFDPLGLSCKNDWNKFQSRTKGFFSSRVAAAVTYKKVKQVLSLKKGTRDSDVSSYLPDSYIKEHSRRFKTEGSGFIAVESWTTGGNHANLPPRKFVGLRSEMDNIVNEYKSTGDWTILRDRLNLGDTVDLSDEKILYVKINPGDSRFSYDIPNGNEAGVIPQEWVPGGFTKAGIHEAALKNSEQVVHNKTLEGISKYFPDSEIIKG